MTVISMAEKISRALHLLRPDAEFAVKGSSLDEITPEDLATRQGIVWIDEIQTRPTDAEIMAVINDLFPAQEAES